VRSIGPEGLRTPHTGMLSYRPDTVRIPAAAIAAEDAQRLERLAARGFETVHPEALGVREQVELFADASHIVAPTGAALTNMVYAPAGSLVVAIYHRAFVAMDGALYFDALAAACGHRFASVLAEAVTSHSSGRTIDADIEVDIGAVEAALA